MFSCQIYNIHTNNNLIIIMNEKLNLFELVNLYDELIVGYWFDFIWSI